MQGERPCCQPATTQTAVSVTARFRRSPARSRGIRVVDGEASQRGNVLVFGVALLLGFRPTAGPLGTMSSPRTRPSGGPRTRRPSRVGLLHPEDHRAFQDFALDLQFRHLAAEALDLVGLSHLGGVVLGMGRRPRGAVGGDPVAQARLASAELPGHRADRPARGRTSSTASRLNSGEICRRCRPMVDSLQPGPAWQVGCPLDGVRSSYDRGARTGALVVKR